MRIARSPGRQSRRWRRSPQPNAQTSLLRLSDISANRVSTAANRVSTSANPRVDRSEPFLVVVPDWVFDYTSSRPLALGPSLVIDGQIWHRAISEAPAYLRIPQRVVQLPHDRAAEGGCQTTQSLTRSRRDVMNELPLRTVAEMVELFDEMNAHLESSTPEGTRYVLGL